VLRELEAFAPVVAVFGNMDEPALKEALPERHVVAVEGVRIGMVHVPGERAGREERLVAWFPDCGAVVYGHTHVPQLEQHRGVWILNPGSPTERRRAPHRSLIVLDVTATGLKARLVEIA
jgi:putative phosphoesterase